MRFAYLTPAGNPYPKCILFGSGAGGKLELRHEYRSLRCPACGRVDEVAAVRGGVSPAVKFQSRKDFVATGDWFICVSERFRQVVADERISGAEFIPMPATPRQYVLVPQLVATDPTLTQMKYLGVPCPGCGRHRESIFRPAVASMAIPADPRSLFMPTVRPEKTSTRMTIVVASEAAADALKSSGVTGIDWKASHE